LKAELSSNPDLLKELGISSESKNILWRKEYTLEEMGAFSTKVLDERKSRSKATKKADEEAAEKVI